MTKKKKEQTLKKLTTRQQWAIGIIVAIIIGLIPVIYEVGKSLPSPNLKVSLYSWYVNTTTSEDNTTYVGLSTHFPSHITNTGNVPLHIIACDVFLVRNGKPSDLKDETLSEIAYLKPEDTFAYNFTKYFSISLPVNSTTPLDLTNYLLLVAYYTQNINDVTSVWKDPSKID